MLETQVLKYQTELKMFEDCRTNLRNELCHLRQQNHCYEHVVACFKDEMTAMSEQLAHLHDILDLSNQSCKEESSHLYCAVADLQKLSDRLHAELKDTEQQMIISNHLNQIKDAQIGELHHIIGQKNEDLGVHGDALTEMKCHLEKVIVENHELKATVMAQDASIMQLQIIIQQYELETNTTRCDTNQCKSKLMTCKKSITGVKKDLERKTQYLNKLQNECQQQSEMLKMLQIEMERSKEKSKAKIRCLKSQNEAMREKLATSEKNNERLGKELVSIRTQTPQSSQKDCSKDHELTQYKQIIIEFRQTLIELNEFMAEDYDVLIGADANSNPSCQEEISASCRCEMKLFKNIVENMKALLMESTKKASNLAQQNLCLRDELIQREAKVEELRKKLAQKEKETSRSVVEISEKLQDKLIQKDKKIDDLRNKLAQKDNEISRDLKDLSDKLKQSQAEEARLSKFIVNLKDEVQNKLQDKAHLAKIGEEEKATTQQEIQALKTEIKKMIHNQVALNSENDKLLNQLSQLQAKVGPLHEKNCSLQEKMQRCNCEMDSLKASNKKLGREKETLSNELDTLQASYKKLEQTYKNVTSSVKHLEMELNDAKSTRDDICTESRYVVHNVKSWLETQRKINDQVKKKTQCYYNALEKLKLENEHLMNQDQNKPPSTTRSKPKNYSRTNSPEDYGQGWNLGSQGTGSIDRDSPCGSPSSILTCSVDEWYSPNYKLSDDEETDEDFIHKIEAFTAGMKLTNKKLKNKCQDCAGKKNRK